MNDQFLHYNEGGGYPVFSPPDLSSSPDFARLEVGYLCLMEEGTRSLDISDVGYLVLPVIGSIVRKKNKIFANCK